MGYLFHTQRWKKGEWFRIGPSTGLMEGEKMQYRDLLDKHHSKKMDEFDLIIRAEKVVTLDKDVWHDKG